jgi:transcription termination factor Rho
MAVLERSELDASPLADLHAIADQLGLDGFRRLRKADLIDAILERTGGGDGESDAEEPAAAGEERAAGPARRRRPSRTRRARTSTEEDGEPERDPARDTDEDPTRDTDTDTDGEAESRSDAGRRRPARPRRTRAAADDDEPRSDEQPRSAPRRGRGARETGRGAADGEERATPRRGRGGREAERGAGEEERMAEGVVELLGNGSAFLRVAPPEVSDDDVYISAAQVRRCELVSGDRISGPVRTPRHSERYPSLARVDTINGASAESVAEGTRYEDLPTAYPSERLELDAEDPTLSAIEWLTPIGRGSRALIVGSSRAGKTEALRRLRDALAGRAGLELTVVLSGVRPEEIASWREHATVEPAAALSFAASADLQGQTVEHVVETAKRVAARGGDVVVLIDNLDGMHPHVARRILASARNLLDGGSLTLIATAARPFGGESTVIALDVALTSTGRLPALDLAGSGTVKPELLVGEDGAAAITRARATAIETQRR